MQVAFWLSAATVMNADVISAEESPDRLGDEKAQNVGRDKLHIWTTVTNSKLCLCRYTLWCQVSRFQCTRCAFGMKSNLLCRAKPITTSMIASPTTTIDIAHVQNAACRETQNR